MAEIALFGGSFDPPHLGHAYVITAVLAREPVDEVWLVPTCVHAFGKALSPFERRRRMCEALAEIFGGRARVSSVEAEIAAPGRPSTTIETVEALRARHPGRRFAWVIGSDLVDEISSWKEAERLRSLVRFIVVGREGHEAARATLAGPPIPDISSTEIRARLAAGRSVEDLVPAAVRDLLEA